MQGSFHAYEEAKYILLKSLLHTPSPHNSLKHFANWTDRKLAHFPHCSPKEEEGTNNPE